MSCENPPSEIVCDGTWWFDELIFYDFVGYKVNDADPSQRLAVFCEALKTFSLCQHTNLSTQLRARTISQSIA
jgi:hypothetical protein